MKIDGVKLLERHRDGCWAAARPPALDTRAARGRLLVSSEGSGA